MKNLKDIVLEKLAISKVKKFLSEEDLLKTKVGKKLGTFNIRDKDGDSTYLYYYSLTLDGKDVAFLEDWSDGDEFGERWQIIVIPYELFESLDLEEDTRNGGFIVPENIKRHIINIFEFDEDENIDIIDVYSWFSMRNTDNYSSNQKYMSFIKKLHEKI